MERPLSKASLAMPADVSYPRRVFRAVTIPILFLKEHGITEGNVTG